MRNFIRLRGNSTLDYCLRTISKSFAVSSLSFSALCFILLTTGCGSSGPELAEVRGTVTYLGKPASGLVVYFVPQSGQRSSGGGTDAEGKFRLIYDPRHVGAIVGNHKVSISVEGNRGKAIAGTGKSTVISKMVEVVSGENNFDLKLEEFEVDK